MDASPPIRHVSLLYSRITALPSLKDTTNDNVDNDNVSSLRILDVTPNTIFFLSPEKETPSLITMEIASEIFSDPIPLPIPDQFEIEQFKLLDSITAICLIRSTRDFDRRVVVLQASDYTWNEITLLTRMDKEWSHKQHLDLLIHFNHPTFYIVDTHQDCIPDLADPDFANPLHTFYRVKLNGDSVDIRSLGSVTDDIAYCLPFSSMLSDSNRILMVKPLFHFDSPDGGGSKWSPSLEQSESYSLQSMELLVYTVDVERESIDKMTMNIKFPSDTHVPTANSCVEMIGNQLVFSQPGGCIMYNIEEKTYTKYTMPDSTRELAVKCTMYGTGLLGMTVGGELLRGYVKTVPSLLEMTHSLYQTTLTSYPSPCLSLSNTHSLIRSLFTQSLITV